MRIAYVCLDPGVPVFGRKGCSVHAQEVLRELIRRGCNVDLFASRVGGKPPCGLAEVRLHRLDVNRTARAVDRERSMIQANDQLYRLLCAAGPFDCLYERHSLFSNSAMHYGLDTGKPTVLEVNAPLVAEQSRYRTVIQREVAEDMAHQAFSAASTLVAVSEEVAAYLRTFPNTRRRVHVIGNGVNVDRFHERTTACSPGTSDTFTVGFVGTLKPWHGVNTLVTAFADLHRDDPRCRLLLVGDGPERAALERQSTALRVADAVTFVGAVEHDGIPGWLASFDVAVAPYPALPDFYFSPLKLFEYMAAGRAIVASEIGAVARLIESERNGVLVTPGDCCQLATALRQLREQPGRRRRLGQAARREAVKEHAWKHKVEQILGIAQPSSVRCPLRREAC